MDGFGDPPRRGRRRSAGGTLDQWMTAGRQLVDGVAGARPGSRSQGRSSSAAAPSGPPGSSRGLQGLGRWVEDRLDWFMEGEDDWPEPWQEPSPERAAEPRPASFSPPPYSTPSSASPPRRTVQAGPESSRAPLGAGARGAQPRRALDAISRRSAPLLPPAAGGEGEEEWPAPQAYELPRWQRPEPAAPAPPNSPATSPATSPAISQRPLPRSSRSRS